jgi:hypothetical protein
LHQGNFVRVLRGDRASDELRHIGFIRIDPSTRSTLQSDRRAQKGALLVHRDNHRHDTT